MTADFFELLIDIRELMKGLHDVVVGPTDLTAHMDTGKNRPTMDYLYDLYAYAQSERRAIKRLREAANQGR